MTGKKNIIGKDLPIIELYQSKSIRTKNRPGYHLCYDGFYYNLTSVAYVSIAICIA